MRARARRRGILIAVATFGTVLAVPPFAHAAISINVAPAPLTPYTSGGCISPRYPCYKAYGTAEPGSKVTVTVTDDVNPGVAVTASTYAATVSDPGSGQNAGDWQVTPQVTDLGTHTTSPSTLAFSAVATDQSGVTSDTVTILVAKVAATPGDSVGPQTTTAAGTASTNPDCGDAVVCSTKFKGCLPNYANTLIGYSSVLIQKLIAVPPNVPPPPPKPGAICNGRFAISGYVDDDWSGAHGVASEVADVVIKIEDADGNVVKEAHSFVRRGPQAFFNTTFLIGDFMIGQTYTWSVQSFDAWNNAGNVKSASFTPMPLWPL